MSISRKLGELICWLKFGHENVGVLENNEWYLRCMHCGHRSHGWRQSTTPPTPLSSEDIKQLTADIEDTENNLLGGG